MRARKDVRNGDVVWRNKRGWWVPLKDDSPMGKTLKVYYKGEVRDLNSEEWSELGFTATPVVSEARTVIRKARGRDVTPYIVVLGVATAITIILFLIIRA